MTQTLQGQIIETIEHKSMEKIKGLVECDKCRLCGKHKGTVHYLLSRCKKQGAEYVKRHNNTLQVSAVKWAVENGLLPEHTKLCTTNW